MSPALRLKPLCLSLRASNETLMRRARPDTAGEAAASSLRRNERKLDRRRAVRVRA